MHPEFPWNLRLCCLLCAGDLERISQTIDTWKGNVHSIVDHDIIMYTTHELENKP